MNFQFEVFKLFNSTNFCFRYVKTVNSKINRQGTDEKPNDERPQRGMETLMSKCLTKISKLKEFIITAHIVFQILKKYKLVTFTSYLEKLRSNYYTEILEGQIELWIFFTDFTHDKIPQNNFFLPKCIQDQERE